MKNKKVYFIALFFAILLPCFIGIIYYKDASAQFKRNKENKIASYGPEIVFDEVENVVKFDDVVIRDVDYKSANHIDFSVSNLNSKNILDIYNIAFSNIEVSQNIDLYRLKWKLLEYNFTKGDYEMISQGDFKNLSDGTLVLEPSIEIGLNNFQKFRLYYYLNYIEGENNNFIGSTFTASIILK